MKIIVTDTNEELSRRAADDIIKSVEGIQHPVICTASGDSPAGLYKELVQRVRHTELDVSDWYFVGLDEWAGMNGDDEGSCRFHLNNLFFHPLKIQIDRI